MAILGEAVVRITAQDAGLRAGMEKAKAAVQSTGAQMERSVAGSAQQMAASLAGAFAGTMLVQGIKNGIARAMEAVESENLFAVSMGTMAKQAREWSEDLGDALGLNPYELRRQVGTFNVMFQSMGLGADQAYQLSTGLTKLAYDMASFYNLEPGDAFEKLRSGMVGMGRPLMELGILVNEAEVQQEAYRMGLVQLGQQMTGAQKVAARYSLIMRQTAKAQGDMARTIGSPSNQLRTLREVFTRLSIQIGMGFLPVIAAVIPALKLLGNVALAVPAPVLALGAALTGAMLVLPTLIRIIRALGEAYTWLAKRAALTAVIQGVMAGNAAAIAKLIGGMLAVGGAIWLVNRQIDALTGSGSGLNQELDKIQELALNASAGLTEAGNAFERAAEGMKNAAQESAVEKLDSQNKRLLDAILERVQANRDEAESIEEKRRAMIGWTSAAEIYKKAAVAGVGELFLGKRYPYGQLGGPTGMTWYGGSPGGQSALAGGYSSRELIVAAQQVIRENRAQTDLLSQIRHALKLDPLGVY